MYAVSPVATRGLAKMGGTLIPTAPGTEPEVLHALAEGSGTELVAAAGQALRDDAVVLVGERLATVPGALSAAAALAEATGARLAWVPRRAGERGALEAGALPTLLPGGRPASDATARAEVASAWGVPTLPEATGRDTAGILAAAAAGEVDALVVGGIDPLDLGVAGAAEALAKAFVVSLEIRPSAVTAVADVVLPVAAHAEKGGTFVDWEGRVRPFEAALETGYVSDYRALDMIADELGEFLGTRTLREVRSEMEALGPWGGARATAPSVEAGEVPSVEPGTLVLATWRHLLDRGSLQDGEPFLAGTAPTPLARVSAATAEALGVVDGDRLTVRAGDTTVTAPVLVAEMADHVVWLPTNSTGSDLRAALAGAPGGPRLRHEGGAGMSTLLALPEVVSLATAGTDNPRADFSDTPLWLSLVKALIIFVYLLVSTLLVIWFERRVIGRMQQRPGPNRNGPFGLLQTLADGMKSMLKEDVRPKAADAFVFTLAPLITATMCFVSFAIIPLAGDVWMFGHLTPFQLTDTPVAVLLVLAVAGVGIYGVVLAGWSSGSTYPLMGGLRSSAQMISYEIAMGLSLVAVFLYAGSMSTSQIVGGAVRPLVRHPRVLQLLRLRHHDGRRDQPAALRPRRGRGRAHRWLPHRVRLDALRDVLPRRVHQHVHRRRAGDDDVPRRLQAPPGIAAINDGMFNEGWWGLLWFTAKLWMFMFVFVWLRGSLPRVRYDQFMRFGWKFLIPSTLAWVVLVAFFRAGQNGWLGGSIDVAGRRFPATSLFLVGIIAVLALVGGWLWDRRAEAREAAAHPTVPEEIDPYAGGFPVPPLPGQRLREPSLSAPALTSGSDTKEATRG